MREIIAVAIAAGALIVPAGAQTPSSQQPDNSPAAITRNDPDRLTPGANSFAEGQARALIEAKGFKNVSALMNDRQGIWRGTAMQGGDKVDVSVDFKGAVMVTPHGGATELPKTTQEAKP